MSPKLGRPYSDNPKDSRIFVRVTSEEKQKIMQFCKDYGTTILELIRKGMDAIKK